uniref:Era-like GTP-binding protein n=1 Tax=Chamaesiphon sp. OTE_75_metabat_556 TaxID=2964692 RepID=UPI00286C4943
MSQSSEDPENLAETIAGFNTIQAEQNYQQAQDTLRRILVKLDLSQRERAGLESEIAELSEISSKLDRSVFQVAVFGMVGRGKSSLLNALIGVEVFEAGVLHGVTKERQQVVWEIDNWQDEFDLDKDTPAILQEAIEFIDTPGIDEVDGAERQLLASEIARQVDLILFVIAGDITELELKTLSQLRSAGKPILLVFNKVDLFPDRDKLAIYAKIRDDRVKEILTQDEIVMTAASPLVARAIRQPDGSFEAELVMGKPQIDDLKL